jgi:2-polyprenyl-3-methyl-5-hydroxy-6-metoxy-1,4-benzoquinol methylase
MEENFAQFIERLQRRGYSIHALDHLSPAFDQRRAYLRHDVAPSDLDAAVRLAALHERLGISGTFHIAWDVIESDARLKDVALRLRDFDPQYVRVGLQCDPISGWLARTRFGGDESRLNEFVCSSTFASYLDDMLAAWRAEGKDAPVLRALHDGAWERLVELDRSFREVFGRSSSISGRGSILSNTFFNARRAQPELSAFDAWLSPIDFLANAELTLLGYPFEATRFAADDHPGPRVIFGGVDAPLLRYTLWARLTGNRGFVAIFPARYWDGDHYAGLGSFAINPASFPGSPVAPFPTSVTDLPDQPITTSLADLQWIDTTSESIDTKQLAASARQKMGGGIDFSFPRFVEWLRSEGYSFGGFEDGPPRFGERWAYLRYDVHIKDLLAAYVLADLHEQLAIVGSFQINWKHSVREEAAEPYFTKLLGFDRRYVQFGLHAAPTVSWYTDARHGGDYVKAIEAAASDDFVDWLMELHAAYGRDGDDAPALREIREGTDDALSRIAASFRATFGEWKSISAHGNFLTKGFAEAQQKHPELNVLQPYFYPVTYMLKYGVARFGFDYEITALGSDRVPFPRVMTEGAGEETRRRWYRGRVANGAGFVALLHPATWTCRQNATFFLPSEDAAGPPSPEPTKETAAPQLEAVIARLRGLVRDVWIARGGDPDRNPAARNIDYNSTDCRGRAAILASYLNRAYGFPMQGKAVCELGCGFGGLCLHWALEHGASSILAVDQVPHFAEALRTLVREFEISGFTVVEADLQEFVGQDETIDLVVLSDVLHTANLSADRVAAACARVLRPGGIVLFRNVNRAYGPEVVTHRDGTQFLDPDSADRAARFMGRGSGSTLAHRPLSPWGLAAFLRQAGFGELRLHGDASGRYDGRRGSQGLRSRYLLAGRKVGAGPRPLHRIAPPPDDVLDLEPFRDAVDREGTAIRAAADKLHRLFAGELTTEVAYAELRSYLIGRLLMDGLATFRADRQDTPACDFAKAIERALDHAFIAVLTRHAGWTAGDFAAADADGLASVLEGCSAKVRKGFQQPGDGPWVDTIEWDAMAARLVAAVLPDNPTHHRGHARAVQLLRELIADRLRLHPIGLFARTADPLTGSVEEEYAEAAIDRIEGEVRDAADSAANGPRPVCRPELMRLVEDMQAELVRGASAASGG